MSKSRKLKPRVYWISWAIGGNDYSAVAPSLNDTFSMIRDILNQEGIVKGIIKLNRKGAIK